MSKEKKKTRVIEQKSVVSVKPTNIKCRLAYDSSSKKKKKEDKPKPKKKKYYVVTPLKESPFDDDAFKLIGTKEDIAEYVKSMVDESYEAKELDIEPLHRKRMFHVDLHSGSRDGKNGWGSSTNCKTYMDAKRWITNQMKEINFEPPHTLIFNITPIYWISKSYLKRKEEFDKASESL